MSTILAAALLSVPILAAAGYLLQRYPSQTLIVVSKGALYAALLFGYLALILILGPVWLQILWLVSFTAMMALVLAPTYARRIIRRLEAPEDAERQARQGDRPT